jgi:hypothetical protein
LFNNGRPRPPSRHRSYKCDLLSPRRALSLRNEELSGQKDCDDDECEEDREQRAIAEAFEAADGDSDGILTWDELERALGGKVRNGTVAVLGRGGKVVYLPLPELVDRYTGGGGGSTEEGVSLEVFSALIRETHVPVPVYHLIHYPMSRTSNPKN